jgi:hypothetical protein
MIDDFVPTKTKTGFVFDDGTEQWHYDFAAHPGFRNAEGEPELDVTKHTHVMVKTPMPLNGTITVNGHDYDLSEHYLAVPIEDVDHLAIATHEACRTTGFTTDPTPTTGPLAAAKAAWDAAVAGAPPATA